MPKVIPTLRAVPKAALPGRDPDYRGEQECSASYKSGKKKNQKCNNKAYYREAGQLRCGVHSCKDVRVELPRNPRADVIKRDQQAAHDRSVETTRQQNAVKGQRGEVICLPLRMMKAAPVEAGFQSVFPNFQHGKRKDGWGLPDCSPKSLGPIHHPQPGLPPAKNLENLHQGSKCFPKQVDPTTEKPNQLFYDTQSAMFQDSEPHRHNPYAEPDASGNRNRPLFSVWREADGKERYVSYFESRQIYCTYYERLCPQTPGFQKLAKALADGTNLAIIGYDGYDFRGVQGTTIDKKLETCYKDISRPFGHELCLVALLICKPEELPWKKFTFLSL